MLGIIFDNLTMFRALRAIRPLRIAIRIQQVKIVLTALIKAIPGVISTIAFCLLFWFVFAVLGKHNYMPV